MSQLIQKLISLFFSLFQEEDESIIQPNDPVLVENIPEYVTEKEYLMGRDVEYPITDNMNINMKCLLKKINKLRHEYKKPFIVSSGYRPGKYNKKAGGSAKSAHLQCMAIDLKDPKGHIKKWLLANRELMIELDLYMEHPDYTPTWVHLQTRPTKNRIFIPY